MFSPIIYKKEITFYKCPKCNEESQYEDRIKEHIITEHEYPEMVKRLGFNGWECKFKDEKEALEVVNIYQKYSNIKYSSTDRNFIIKLEWTKSGKYLGYTETKVEGWYESTTIHITTFKWIGE